MLRLVWSHAPSSASYINSSRILSHAFFRRVNTHSLDISLGRSITQILCPFYDNSPGLRFRTSCNRAAGVVHFRMASGGEGPGTSSPKPKTFSNRLSKEKSPYLLQHAHNPVDWFPWGQEAFEKAKSEDKPIFLSVGYSTCHWCHVMERESFEDEEIGKILSENFVCIKVDREERPDVDKVYMTFVQATSGGGGWPMSVWLTPELRPFIGGTYFPPRDTGRRPGLKTVLSRILEQWQGNREALESSGVRAIEALTKGTSIAANEGQTPPSGPDVANRCFQQLAHSYDEDYGGFREAPKFPSPVNFTFLLSFWAVNRSTSDGAEALQMALHTLRMMALGGIHDHVAQGFHRYSTDSSWHVPHFEKMLYDQAQLAVAYITAYQVSKEQVFADVARDVLLYVSRDLSDKSGGFYSAEDADSLPTSECSEKKEGAFCVWTAAEIRQLLSEIVEGATGGATQADIFMHHYGVKEQGNVEPEQDPHGELLGQNVLIVRYSVELTAAQFGLDLERVTEILASSRTKLAEVRRARPPPHLDSKMLASWNGHSAKYGSCAMMHLQSNTIIDIQLVQMNEVGGSYHTEREGLRRSLDLLEVFLVDRFKDTSEAWKESLMLSGFARVGAALGDKALLKRAEEAAHFLKRHLWDEGDRRMLHSCYRGEEMEVEQIESPIAGFLDDYAYVVAGLLDLFEATQAVEWLQWAEELQLKQDQLFWDDQGGGYFCSDPSDPTVLLKLKQDQDGAEPSANSVSALNLLRLSQLTGKQDWMERCQRLLAAFSDRLVRVPIALPDMVRGLMALHYSLKQIVICGQPDAEDTANLIACVHSLFLPHKVLLVVDSDTDGFLHQRLPVLSSLRPLEGRATAFVCQNFSCALPVTCPQELRRLLLE